MNKKLLIVLVASIAVVAGWFFFNHEGNYIPKPKGYFRIFLPEKSYRPFEAECPLSFEVPSYSKVELFRDHLSSDSCWFNLFFPKLNARLHCTYVPINGNLGRLLNDSYGFAAKHEMKASALKRTMVSKENDHVYGIVYDIEGDAASQLQFFLTDSTKHFFRGSLYFFNAPNPDSVAPVLNYLREDIMHMAETMQWK
jgi:gliding motility-associated lipoprotein GldD